jgi:hypothetical protein
MRDMISPSDKCEMSMSVLHLTHGCDIVTVVIVLSLHFKATLLAIRG